MKHEYGNGKSGALGALLLALAGGAAGGAAAEPPPVIGDAAADLRATVFVAFDTETTGFSPRKDRLVEIGVVRFRIGEELEEKSWLINPQRNISPGAVAVHGITTDMVARAPTFAEIYPEFLAFISNAVLWAHNAPFDVGFLRAEARRAGLPAPTNLALNSLPLFRRWFPDAPSHSIGRLMEHLRLRDDGFHRAAVDARYIRLILEYGLRDRPDVNSLDALIRAAGGPVQPPPEPDEARSQKSSFYVHRVFSHLTAWDMSTSSANFTRSAPMIGARRPGSRCPSQRPE